MTELPRIANLLPAQADGLACVVCRTSLLTAPAGTAFRVVGRSITGSQVHACAPPRPCAGRYKRPAEVAS